MLNKSYGCIDDCLDEYNLNHLVNVLSLSRYMKGTIEPNTYKNNNFFYPNWYYSMASQNSGNGTFPNNNSWNRPQFAVLYNDANSLSNYIAGVGSHILHKHFNINNNIYFYRMKLNMGIKAPNNSKYLIPHLDSIDHYHISMTLFLGISDGDHIIFNEKDPDLSSKDNSKLTILNQYNHKNNRLVYNTGHYHCNYDPVEYDHRLALNYVVYFKK